MINKDLTYNDSLNPTLPETPKYYDIINLSENCLKNKFVIEENDYKVLLECGFIKD